MRFILPVILFCLTASAQFGLRSPVFVGSLAPRASGGSPPAAPSSLIATGDTTGITIHWVDNSSNEDGFKVEVFNGLSGAVWANAVLTSCGAPGANPTAANTITTFEPKACATSGGGQLNLCEVIVRVIATNSFGTNVSSEIQVAPSIVIGDLDADTTIDAPNAYLTWTPTGETGGTCAQFIYRSINGGGYVEISSGNEQDISNYTDYSEEAITAIGLMQTILYKVRNQNVGGNGPYSNVATAHP